MMLIDFGRDIALAPVRPSAPLTEKHITQDQLRETSVAISEANNVTIDESSDPKHGSILR